MFVDEVSTAIADAMRKHDPARLSALRMLKAALMNRAIEKGHDLDDAESRQVVTSLVKQRRDSIEQFTAGGRQDLADKESAEITVLESYLPPAADPAVVERAVADAIAETGAASAKDIGRVMKAGDGQALRPERGRQGRQRARAEETGRLNRAAPARPALLARSAGLAGAATLTSRILGLVRDQVLAALFGAGNEMDAFLVAFRIPNLARDLFAEGAMSAAFVPAFTRQLTSAARPTAWRLANNVLNTLLARDGGSRGVLGILFAGPLVTAYAGDYAAVPGKLALTDQTDARDAAVSDARHGGCAADGNVEFARSLLRAGACAGRCSTWRRSSACSRSRRLMAGVGEPAIMAVAIGALVGGIGLVARAVPAALA